MTPLETVKLRCLQACAAEFPNQGALEIEITPATNRKFGHYQCNSAMKLTKIINLPPRAIAEKISAQLANDPIFARVEIAGPGFINFTLSEAFLSQELNAHLNDPRLGCAIATPDKKQRVIIDFSSPNIAKEMHVGHLRSTIIGDAIARVLEFLGHDVLRINHVGDWGTQFGMLITYLMKTNAQVSSMDLTALLNAYRNAKIEFDADPIFKQEAQQAVVALQSGDPHILEIWRLICEVSRRAFAQVYQILDIKLQERGESFYNPMLPEVVADLTAKGLITESDGAKCVYIPGFANREGDPLPLIVQKTDGGYNYATTDIAALRQRVTKEHGTWLIYVTDAGQSQHFSMVFAACRLAKYYDPNLVRVDHVPFGLVLRADGKKFQTRSGDTERLIDLLHMAQTKALEKLSARPHTDLSKQDLHSMSQILGINAIKYADLANNRTSDYSFSFDRMLQFEGNTAAFICYAYVRVQSIKRKVNVDIDALLSTQKIHLQTPEEIELGLQLLQFPDTINVMVNELMPNRLTEYLFALAEKFHVFFHNCRVEGVPEQNSRLLLCEITARTLNLGLQLLGLQPLTKM